MEFDFTLPGLGRPESSRPKRIAEAIKHELSILLLQKVGDPRLEQVTISNVVAARDLKYAKIYFVVPSGANVGQAKKGMERAKGFFRSHLAKTLNLRYTPDLAFFYDSQHEKIDHLDALFEQIKQEKKSSDSVE